jgi:DNA-binding GntR family transcriptional regulator
MASAAEDHETARTSRRRGYGAKYVFEKLRDEILSLELKPGQLIDEASLAARFKVSRSPVREALVRLETEGLIDTLPNKGTIVTPLNIEEFPHYIDALDLIQRAVTRLAAAHRDDKDLHAIKHAQAEFRKHVAANDALGMIEQNARFHLAIGSASKNRILTDTYRRILNEGRRALRLYFRSYADTLPPELCDAHDRMIEAIERRDTDMAERLAHEHAEEVHQRFIHYISRRSTRDIAMTS